MPIDHETICRLALLTHIQVKDDRVDELQHKLSDILSWIEQLNEVDVSSVVPLVGANKPVIAMRADAVTDGGYRTILLSSAPAHLEAFYVVPKVVD